LAWGSSNEVGLTLKATVGWGQKVQPALKVWSVGWGQTLQSALIGWLLADVLKAKVELLAAWLKA
jgi:hypothetical protein